MQRNKTVCVWLISTVNPVMYLFVFQHSVEGGHAVAESKACNAHQQTIIDPQSEWKFDIQIRIEVGCDICSPYVRSEEASAAMEQHQQVVGFCDAPVLVTIVQHACTEQWLVWRSVPALTQQHFSSATTAQCHLTTAHTLMMHDSVTLQTQPTLHRGVSSALW